MLSVARRSFLKEEGNWQCSDEDWTILSEFATNCNEKKEDVLLVVCPDEKGSASSLGAIIGMILNDSCSAPWSLMRGQLDKVHISDIVALTECRVNMAVQSLWKDMNTTERDGFLQIVCKKKKSVAIHAYNEPFVIPVKPNFCVVVGHDQMANEMCDEMCKIAGKTVKRITFSILKKVSE